MKRSDNSAPVPLGAARLNQLRRLLLSWFDVSGRSFFWRRERVSPYQVLFTEMLLSRTRAENVEPVAQVLFACYPDVRTLALASLHDVEKILFPLGLFRKRARFVSACANAIVSEHGGQVPREFEGLETLPYVGRYAANAVMNVAFDIPRPIVDANVARVYRRVFSLPEPPARLESAHALWRVAERVVPKRQSRRFNWALLDLGASVCGRTPKCGSCPLARLCDYGVALRQDSRAHLKGRPRSRGVGRERARGRGSMHREGTRI